MEWTATGRVFDAAEALDAGLVRSVYPPEDLLPAAYAVAAEIVANTAPVSVALNRQMLWRMLGAEHPMVAHELIRDWDSHAVHQQMRRRALPAFLEKRGAQFADRVSVDMPADYPWWEPRPFRSSPS